MSDGTTQQPTTHEGLDVDGLPAQIPEQEKFKITKRGRRRGRHGKRRNAAPLVVEDSSEEDELPVSGLTPTQSRTPAERTQRLSVVTWGDLGSEQPPAQSTASTTAPTTAVASPVAAASGQEHTATNAVAGWWYRTPSVAAQAAAVPTYSFPGSQGGGGASSITTIHVGGTAHHGINWETVHWAQGDVHTANCFWPPNPSFQQADEWTPEHSEVLRLWLCQQVGGGTAPSPAHVEELLRTSAPSAYED